MSRRLTELWDDFGIENMVLAPLSGLYALGWSAYRAVYELGLKRAAEPHKPVVCVGNLRVGGVGKTPTVLHLAQALQDLGRDVVLGLSGYGSPSAQGARLCPAGPLSPRTWGDEPALARFLMPEVPLIVGRRRVLAAEICAQTYPGRVLLMDDGFQHLPLRKHLTILLDPPQPVNRLCLPAGPYREPRSARKRADLVVPGEFQAVRARTRVWRHDSGAEATHESDASALVGTRVSAVCALGSPRSFLETLERLGAHVVDARIRRDHDPLTEGNLLAGLDPRIPIATTLKDWVKLRERADLAEWRFLVLHYDVAIEPQKEFRVWLSKRLDETAS